MTHEAAVKPKRTLSLSKTTWHKSECLLQIHHFMAYLPCLISLTRNISKPGHHCDCTAGYINLNPPNFAFGFRSWCRLNILSAMNVQGYEVVISDKESWKISLKSEFLEEMTKF